MIKKLKRKMTNEEKRSTVKPQKDYSTVQLMKPNTI